MCSHHHDVAALDRLGREITELASHIHAATCRWLGLVAEFDRREGWGPAGCKSCAHWISWRCGIAPSAAREHVRVAHRLGELPLIRAAFAAGQLSYSKVRALSRVGAVEREDTLLMLAEHATAAQLERMVRAYRGVVTTEQAAAGGRPQRYVTWEHADDGSLLLRARLPAEEGEILLTALEAGIDRLRDNALPPPVASASAEAPAVPECKPDATSSTSAEAPAVPDRVPAVAASASAEAPAVPDRLPAALARASAGAPAVPESMPDATSSVSAQEPAAPDHVPAALTPPSAEAPAVPDRLPAVTASASAEAPSASDDAHAAAPRPPGDVSDDADAPPGPSVSELRADALLLMADTLLAHGADARGGDRYQVVLHVDTAALAGGGAAGRCELSDGAPLAAATARRLACDAAIVPLLERDGKPLSVGRKTRAVPHALRRALAGRDRGCRFPGCSNRCSVDAHHVRHWAHGGATSLDNLVQVCRYHHRLLHEGGYTVESSGAGFVFRRPDGRQLHAVPRPPKGRVRALHDRIRPIHPEACVPKSGEPMDLALCVDALLSAAPAEAPGI